MAKKEFKMILPFQDDPLFEERIRLVNESFNLAIETSFLRKQIEVAVYLGQNASSDDSKKLAIQRKDSLRAELASMEIKMARVNASIRKLNKDIKVRAREIRLGTIQKKCSYGKDD